MSNLRVAPEKYEFLPGQVVVYFSGDEDDHAFVAKVTGPRTAEDWENEHTWEIEDEELAAGQWLIIADPE